MNQIQGIFFKKSRSLYTHTHHTRVCLTLGTGERSSAASCRSGINGMSKRLGRTKKEAMESMIIVSETELQKKAFYFNTALPYLPLCPLQFSFCTPALKKCHSRKLPASTTHSLFPHNLYVCTYFSYLYPTSFLNGREAACNVIVPLTTL